VTASQPPRDDGHPQGCRRLNCYSRFGARYGPATEAVAVHREEDHQAYRVEKLRISGRLNEDVSVEKYAGHVGAEVIARTGAASWTTDEPHDSAAARKLLELA
jgi:hypothetical protein